MSNKYLFLFAILFSAQLSSAQEQISSEIRQTFANISILGPVSTNGIDYDRTSVELCIGLIACSARSLDGLGISYIYNSSVEDMTGLAAAGVGNLSRGNGTGIHFGLFTNVTLGNFNGLQLSMLNVTTGNALTGLQLGYANYMHGNVTGLQTGFLNVIGGVNPNSDFAVQTGFINFSNQAHVIPIGFLSIVRGGRFSVGLDRDALGFNRFPILIGSRYFFTTFEYRASNLNPNQDETNPRNFVRGIGLGGAIPVTEEILGRFEYIYYTPTGWRSDSSNVIRVVGEYEMSPYLAFHAGLENLGFIFDKYERTSLVSDNPDSSTSLTAGFSFNLLGWWR